MAEVEELCGRIAILNRGRIAFLGTVEELDAKVGKHYTLRVTTVEGEQQFVTDDVADTLLTLLEGYKSRGAAVLDIKIGRGSLEEHFMEIAKGAGV